VITIYAFSLENFHRPKEQVDELMVLLRDLFLDLHSQNSITTKYDIKVRAIGRIEMLGDDLQKAASEVVAATKNNRSRILNICLAYTARDEITTAIKKSVSGCIFPGEVTTNTLTDNMFIGLPPPDLLIRTSGVHRLSDFLLWQCHQDTEIEIVDVKWPEFGVWNIAFILLKWQRRRREEWRLP
jgi:ditrans,polycis-polyprenyl diphosphate synthase